MTTRKPDDLTDLRFDAAWRAASREEPSPALDDAIRAAARREAGAGPRHADTTKTALPAALQPERWWWPLAAAATIGVIAIGLLQLAAPDRIGAPAGDKTVVSDMPAPPAGEKQRSNAVRDEATAAPHEEAAKPANAEPPRAAPAPTSTAADARMSVVPSAPPDLPAAPALRKDTAAPVGQEERAGARADAPGAPAPPPAMAAVERRRQKGVDDVAPAPVAEPFPADAAKREAKEAAVGGLAAAPAKTADLDAAGKVSGKLAEAPAIRAESASEPQRAAAPVATPSTDRAYAQRAAPTQDRFAPTPPPAAGGAAAPVAQSAAPAPFPSVRKTQEAESVRAKERVKLPVAEWITLIRKLRDEGQIDEAAKELVAFRAAYSDHERLLPPDLRDWRPAMK